MEYLTELESGIEYIQQLMNTMDDEEQIQEYLRNVMNVIPLYVEYYAHKAEHRVAGSLIAEDPENGMNPSKRYEIYDPVIRRMADIQNGVVSYVKPSNTKSPSNRAALTLWAYLHAGQLDISIDFYPEDYPFIFYKAPLTPNK